MAGKGKIKKCKAKQTESKVFHSTRTGILFNKIKHSLRKYEEECVLNVLSHEF